jgi:hypothetical protein
MESVAMGLVNVGYKTLLANHPKMGFKELINGPIKTFHDDAKTGNTCCSKLCYAFNHVPGHYINVDGDYGKGGKVVKKIRMLMDLDGWEYIYSTLDLRQYLNNRYGNGELMSNTAKIGARPGIVIFDPVDKKTFGHVDIWSDGHIDSPEFYDQAWYEKIQKDRIYFWDLNP